MKIDRVTTPTSKDPDEEITIDSRVAFSGRLLTVRTDRVRLPDGRETDREIVVHRGAVAIVAIDTERRVLLVRQYRKAAEASLLEIPAGTLEPGEEPLACAERELIEETGQRAAKLERICGFYTAPGFCTEFLHVFAARDLSPAHAEADADERIEVVRLPFEQCLRLVRSGEIRDAKSIVGLLAVEVGWGGMP